MQILLDTHSFLWFITGDSRCSAIARELIVDPTNQVFVSITGLWEIAIKTSIGKLALKVPFDQLIRQQLTDNTIDILPITLAELEIVAQLPFYHRDPFDRLLVAHALVRNIPLVSADPVLEQYGVKRFW